MKKTFFRNLSLGIAFLGLSYAQLQAQCVVENMVVPTTLELNVENNLDANFIAKAKGVKDARVWIFDHWGNKVFQSSVSVMQASLKEEKELDTGWNGTKNGEEIKEGLYVYSIEATCVDGTRFRKGGTVQLLKPKEAVSPQKAEETKEGNRSGY